MSTSKFAEVHNMVAFLSKPTESKGFEKVIDFLKANPIKRDLQFGDEGGVDCLPNDAIFEQLTLMGYEKLSRKLTFYKAFFYPQWKFLIHIILQCLSAKTVAWNKFSITMASAIICLATNQKFNFSKYVFESMMKNLDSVTKFLMYPRNMKMVGKGFPGRETPLFPTMMVQAQEEICEGVNTPRSGEDSQKLNELMELCTNLQKRVLALKATKTTQALEIDSLKRRVRKLEKKKRSRTHKLKRLYKVGLSARVESSEDECLGEEDASKQGKIADIDNDEDITLVNDQEMFDVNDLQGEEVFVEEEVTKKDVNAANITSSVVATITVDEVTLAQALMEIKSKGIMVEPKKPLKKKDQISHDEELALKLQDELQAKFDQEQRLAEERAQQEQEANIALIKTWDDVQAKIDANYQLAQRLQAEEQEALTGEEKKVEEDKESVDVKRCLEIILNDEDYVTIDATYLSSKSLTIVDYKIYKEGKKSYFEIFRADGNSQIYFTFSKMLKFFDKKDLEVLWRLVKARFEKVQPVDNMDSFVLHNLKTMFEHHVEDNV
nr:hypothetical protein [Tanacetum cinerariifolium]